MALLKNRWLHAAILVLVCFYYYQLCLKSNFLQIQYDGDEPSYTTGFTFSSLKDILSEHRTFGLPLIYKTAGLFFSRAQWPMVQFCLVTFLLLWTFKVFIRARFHWVLSAAICLSLALDSNLLLGYGVVRTESLSLAFFFLTLAYFFAALFHPKRFDAILFSFFLFVTYMVRPNMAFVAVIFATCTLFGRKQRRFVCVLSLAPLFLFMALRWAVVGHFGVVSYAGTNLIGHAMIELDQKTVSQLPSQFRELGDELLGRKMRTHSSVCQSLPPDPAPEFIQQRLPCHNSLQMAAWQLMIEKRYHLSPFTDPALNIEPWRHVPTLSNYFSVPNVEIDKELMVISKEILKIKSKSYWMWVYQSYVFAINESWAKFTGTSAYRFGLFWIEALSIALGFIAALLWRSGIRPKLELEGLYRELIFLLLAGGIYTVGNLLTNMLAFPNARYYEQFSVLMQPVLWVTLGLLLTTLLDVLTRYRMVYSGHQHGFQKTVL